MATRRRRFAEHRKAVGYTQETLAEALGLERATVGRWERGTQSPLPEYRPRLAKALRITSGELAELLDEEPPPAPLAKSPVGTARLSDLRGDEVVDSIFGAAQGFQLADRRVGGGALYPSILQYLAHEIAPQLMMPSSGVPVHRLFSAAASVTEIAGWMAHDSGKDDYARGHFDRAYRLAVAGRDRALAANACASMAHLAIELRQPADALRIASEGLAHAGSTHGTSRLIARLHAMRARSLALTGDRTGCCDELETADRILGGAVLEQPAQWIAAFDEASLASEAALCFLQLAELDEAERRASQVISLRSGDRIRSRTFAKLTLARVLVHAGRIDEAALIGEEACNAATSLNSARVVHQLRALGGALSLAPESDQVSTFRTALAGIASTSGERDGSGASWPV